eukprot:5241927-Amphidinium_carterae.3
MVSATASLEVLERCVPLDVTETVACDPKKSAVAFMMRNVPAPDSMHIFKRVEDLLGSETAWCQKHQHSCDVPRRSSADIVCAGFPCAPYSAQRAARYSEDGGCNLLVTIQLRLVVSHLVESLVKIVLGASSYLESPLGTRLFASAWFGFRVKFRCIE